jgi:hypothetical protein
VSTWTRVDPTGIPPAVLEEIDHYANVAIGFAHGHLDAVTFLKRKAALYDALRTHQHARLTTPETQA